MKKQKSTPVLEEHELKVQAIAHQNSGRYKEAIQLYKKLLQISDNEQWREALSRCYVLRAQTFAAKAMYKEALVLWENHVPYAQPPYQAQDEYIIWLILTNNETRINSSLEQLSALQLDKHYPKLAAVLGMLMLSSRPQWQQLLPQASDLMAHFNYVQTALQAYQSNDLEKLQEALKQLPYRSAFRDFRILLNAAVTLPDSLEQAQAQFAKIPADSPYSQAARLLLACTKEGAELAKELVQLSHQQRKLIGEIKGLDQKQMDFVEHYCRQHSRLSDKIKFNMVIQYQAILGSEFAQQFCQSLLVNYPAGHKDFRKHFAESDDFEENRLMALNYEQQNDPYEAEYYWRLCLDALGRDETNDHLKSALILRRMASKESDGEARTELLIESLQHDPGDRNSYLHIIQYFEQQSEAAKDYKLWLTKTLEQFPQDIEVLSQAVKAATRNKTYKKASQFATKILKIDPLNTFAKQTLFSSHLAHAQRLMREKSYRLVEKELTQLEKLNLGKAYQRRVQLMCALLCLAHKDKAEGLQRIVKELAAMQINPVSTHFVAAVEALLNGLPVATILRELPPAKDYVLSAQDLTALVQQLKQYATHVDDREYLSKALDKIKVPLKKSLTGHDFDEALVLSLCEILDDIGHFELLRHCVKQTQSKWPKPIWMYYRVYADNNGNASDCSFTDVSRLNIASTDARNNKDYQAAVLIDKFLESYYKAHPRRGGGFDFFEELFGEDDDDEFDPLEELFGHLPERELIKMNKMAESLSKKLTPEKLILEFVSQVGSSESLFLAMLKNPDIYSALMMLKAAKMSGVDVGVNIDDIIEVFGISEDDNSFPFPFPF